jgi:hypothetical protein
MWLASSCHSPGKHVKATRHHGQPVMTVHLVGLLSGAGLGLTGIVPL